MKSRFVLSLMLAAVAQVSVATVPLFEINAPLYSPPDLPPQIDAVSVAVNNSFSIGSTVLIVTSGGTVVSGNSLPFDTTGTRFFTNNGVMFHDVGWRLDFVNGANRSWQSNFVNRGSIEGGTYLLISSTNVTSTGLLSAGPAGLLQINGKNVNLSGSGVRTGASTNGLSSGSIPTPIYWASGTNNHLDNRGPTLRLDTGNFDLPLPTSTSHQINEQGFTNTITLPNFNFSYTAYAFTNVGIVQVVFVPTDLSAYGVTTDVRFGPAAGDNGERVALVRFSQPQLDPVTGTISTNLLFVSDSAALLTNRITLVNQGGGLFIPTNYTVSQFTSIEWLNSPVPGNTAYSPSLLWDPTLQDNAVTNQYTAYGAAFGSIASLFNFTTGAAAAPSNSVGRIEINADTLNLRNTRIRAESFISIKATSLQSNNFAKVEAPVVTYDIAVTNATLTLSNLYAPTVTRFGGEILAWTALWSNQNTNTGTTNKYHVLIVDPIFAGTSAATLYDLTAKATNLVIRDQLVASHSLKLDAESLTVGLSSGLSFGSTSTNSIGSNNIPRLKYLTNEGSILIPGSASLGADRPQPLSNIVNSGSIEASVLSVKARSLVDFGILKANAGLLDIDALTAAFTNDVLTGASDLRIFARDMAARGSQFTAGAGIFGQLRLSVTNQLTDGGSDANNQWTCTDGFTLYRRPINSSLLGTTINSTVGQFHYSVHTWAATNLGATASGYTSNAALGRLILDSTAVLAGFSFSGVGTSNALYVDYLEFRDFATNYQYVLGFDNNIVLYFADSNLPAGKLDGAYGGHLRWVKNFAGPNSSTNAPLRDGSMITVNRQLVMSSEIDSDADGIPNNIDSFPFDGARFSNVVVTNGPPRKTTITWNSSVDTLYTVEFKTNLNSTSWSLLTNITSTVDGPLSVQDAAGTPASKFYRVRYTP